MNNFVLQAVVLNNLEQVENAAANIRQRRLRNQNVYVTLTEELFRKHFRLSKQAFEDLMQNVEPFLLPPRRVGALTKVEKVLVALNFFGTGSYQAVIGSNVHCSGISQATVSRCIKEVVEVLNHPVIFNRWVQFPSTIQELQNNRRAFFNKFRISGIIGVIDCTHVAIVPPDADDPNYPEHLYVNRKNYTSLNVQLVCDDVLKIINVNSRFPGSTHDVHIFNNSAVHGAMVNLSRQQQGFYLIGDSGYALRSWLQIPIPDALPDTPEFIYNMAFRRARSLIERCNGLLKMRFRCLLKHRTLHYQPTKAGKIVNACVVLHNICLKHNVPNPEMEEGDADIDFGIFNEDNGNNNEVNAQRRNPDLIAGERIQRTVIRAFTQNNL